MIICSPFSGVSRYVHVAGSGSWPLTIVPSAHATVQVRSSGAYARPPM